MVDLLMLLLIWMIEGIGKLFQFMLKTFWVMMKITFWLITLPFRIIGAIIRGSNGTKEEIICGETPRLNFAEFTYCCTCLYRKVHDRRYTPRTH